MKIGQLVVGRTRIQPPATCELALRTGTCDTFPTVPVMFQTGG